MRVLGRNARDSSLPALMYAILDLRSALDRCVIGASGINFYMIGSRKSHQEDRFSR